jgi:hypothetical protein
VTVWSGIKWILEEKHDCTKKKEEIAKKHLRTKTGFPFGIPISK